MAITLDTVVLPDELVWADEYGWSQIKSKNQYTLQGKLVIEENMITKGRPITLYSENAWIDRDDLNILHGMAQEFGKTMTLTMHDGKTYSVGFRHWEQPVIEAENLTGTPFQTDDVIYVLTLKLVEI